VCSAPDRNMHYVWLLPIGFLLGAFGTLIGAGGGFLLVPILLLLYPGEKAETITSISLAVVFFNALSGSIAYGRRKRIDYRAGFLLSAAAIPGAMLGAAVTSLIPRRTFDIIFGILLLVGGTFLLFGRQPEHSNGHPGEKSEGEPVRPVLVYNTTLGVLI